MIVQDWSTVTTAALNDSWARVVVSLPNLLGAIVILAIGVLVANLLKWVVARIIETTKLQGVFDQLPFAQALKAAKMSTDLAKMSGEFVKWVSIIFFLIPAASVIGLSQVSQVLNDIIRYLPNVGIVVIILFLGALFADFMSTIVRATAAGLGSHTASSLSVTTRYAIYVFIGLAALLQLGIAEQIISILLTGFVAATAIASGLAFGLGGKDAASDLITKIRRDYTNK